MLESEMSLEQVFEGLSQLANTEIPITNEQDKTFIYETTSFPPSINKKIKTECERQIDDLKVQVKTTNDSNKNLQEKINSLDKEVDELRKNLNTYAKLLDNSLSLIFPEQEKQNVAEDQECTTEKQEKTTSRNQKKTEERKYATEKREKIAPKEQETTEGQECTTKKQKKTASKKQEASTINTQKNASSSGEDTVKKRISSPRIGRSRSLQPLKRNKKIERRLKSFFEEIEDTRITNEEFFNLESELLQIELTTPTRSKQSGRPWCEFWCKLSVKPIKRKKGEKTEETCDILVEDYLLYLHRFKRIINMEISREEEKHLFLKKVSPYFPNSFPKLLLNLFDE